MRNWQLRMGVAATGLALLTAVAGCGSSDSSSAASSPSISGETSVDPVPGVFVGECGSATEAEVSTTAGIGPVQLVTHNPLRCRWAGRTVGSAVDFAWFRASTMADHHPHDAGTTVLLDGRPGVVWPGTHTCEVALESGGVDFVAWTVDAAAAGTVDAICHNAENLATMSVRQAP